MHNYISFLEKLDAQLEIYHKSYSEHIFCQKGCSYCCEKGDYPLSEIELRYLMLGYSGLDNKIKLIVQQNIRCIEKSGKCPFLINQCCSIYKFRPIICRVHGLPYICSNNLVKLPYCVNNGLNFSKVYVNNEFIIEPIKTNLDTFSLLKEIDCGEIRNLYDWLYLNN